MLVGVCWFDSCGSCLVVMFDYLPWLWVLDGVGFGFMCLVCSVFADCMLCKFSG